MTGKQLVLDAIECKKTARIPWVPFCGVHTGSLIGKTAAEYLKSPDNIVAGLEKAVELYKPDGIPIIFDLQIEAEILGCELSWSDDNPPAVISHPLSDRQAVLEDLRLPTEYDGRIPIVVEALKKLRAAHPELAIYGLITGPFTLALHLMGADIFMGMFDDPEQIKKLLAFCAEYGKTMSKIYIENGCDIIAVVDPMTSQIGPDQFTEFCTAPCTAVFDGIHELGAKGSFFVCGHAKNNIEVMCDCHCDNISIDENIPLDYVGEICRAKGVSFGGNLQLTTVMLLGTPQDNKINATECMDIGGATGFILAPGCDMPYATPKENVIAIVETVYSKYERKVARELAKNKTGKIELLDLSDRFSDDKVIIDIVTLDSKGCAPCQYMVEAVKEVATQFGDAVEWHEHAIKNPEAIVMMQSLGVKNIPTLCIDGRIEFISRIPTKAKLAEAIQTAIDNK